MKTLKSLFFTILTVAFLTIITSLCLTFVMPETNFNRLVLISFLLWVAMYLVYKLTSILLKVVLFLLIVGGAAYFFMGM